MKYLNIALVSLISCTVAVSGENLRHRELRDSVMCLDLGKRKGLHNMKVTRRKYMKKLVKQNADAEEGPCTEKTTMLKNRLQHPHEFCKNYNKDHVTILAPEGMRKFLIKEVGATKGACDEEDNYVVIYE